MATAQLKKKLYSKLVAALGLVVVLAIALRISPREAPSAGMLRTLVVPGIVIDPGHGGYDGGAVWEGVVEKDINLDISLHLREVLLASGYRVALTRYGDYSLVELAQAKKREDMVRRLAIIEQFSPDYFICIHCNAMSSTRWRGGQTFFQHESEQGLELAQDVQHYLREFTDTTRLANSLDHFLLRESHSIGCLVEAGFLSNTADRELLQQRGYQRRVAVATWLGIEKYSREKSNNPANQ